MKKIFFFIFLFFLLHANTQAQNTLGLNDCYDMLQKNYPLSKQKEFITQNTELNKQNIQRVYLPQLSLNAQATYQSAVTALPIEIPRMEVPAPNKDQYKATINLNQIVFDGGTVRTLLAMQDIDNNIQKEQVETALYQMKNKVNQLYFGILLLQEKKKLLLIVKDNLNSKYKEVKSAVDNGLLLPSSADIIHAEILKTEQQLFEMEADRKVSLTMLSQLISTPITENTLLQNPSMELGTDTKIVRPEIKLYDLQKRAIDANSILSDKKHIPKLMIFAQGGYGNPGLNMLDNSFQPFYMTGIKINWELQGRTVVNNQKQIFSITKKIIDNQQEVFELNTNITLTQLKSEVEKIEQLIKTDTELIALRKNIVQSAESQMKNGTITSSQYITELTALNEAEITKKTHEIQLLSTKANYKITLGN